MTHKKGRASGEYFKCFTHNRGGGGGRSENLFLPQAHGGGGDGSGIYCCHNFVLLIAASQDGSRSLLFLCILSLSLKLCSARILFIKPMVCTSNQKESHKEFLFLLLSTNFLINCCSFVVVSVLWAVYPPAPPRQMCAFVVVAVAGQLCIPYRSYRHPG